MLQIALIHLRRGGLKYLNAILLMLMIQKWSKNWLNHAFFLKFMIYERFQDEIS